MKKYKIKITCSDKKERDILFDIIKQHELITVIYDNHAQSDNVDSKNLTLANNTLAENLYNKLTELERI